MEVPTQEVAVANGQQLVEAQSTASYWQHALHLKALVAHVIVGPQSE